MSPIEIIFVLLGIVFLIASCFIGGKEEKNDAAIVFPEEALEIQKQELKKYADQLFEEKSEETVVKTDDYLSKISNEKIMSVNDFSAQIIEKIDANHKEVVFLYDMLNKKEDEIKQTVQKFDAEKQEMQEVVGDIVRLTKQMKTVVQKSDRQKSTAVEKNKKTETQKNTPKTEKQVQAVAPMSAEKMEASIKAVENREDGQFEFADMLQADKQKEEVLKLYKQGKSVLEISKAMGMGQGEVKLIIGLYGV